MIACNIVGTYIVDESSWSKLSNAACLGSMGQDGLSYTENILAYLYGFTNVIARNEFPGTQDSFKYGKISEDLTLIEIDIAIDLQDILISDIKRILYELSNDLTIRFISPDNNKSIDCEMYLPNLDFRRFLHKFYVEGKQRGLYIPNNKGKYKRVHTNENN